MKKLLLAVAVLFATSAVAQSKGETQFGMGGNLFRSDKPKTSGAKSATEITPNVSVRYLMTNKIGLDGALGIRKGNKYSRVGEDLGITLGVGGRYYYYSQDKMRLNGGIDIMYGLGDGAKRNNEDGDATSPLDVSITLAELEYWPMESGAIYGAASFDLGGLNLGDAGSTGFGLGLGVKIRIK